ADAAFRSQNGKTIMTLRAAAQNLQSNGVAVGKLAVDGSIADPLARPVLALNAHADGLQLQGFTGTADADLAGSPEKIAIRLTSDSATQNGERLSFAATADANVETRKIALHDLHGTWLDQKFALLAPAAIDYANGIAIDHLTADFATARVELAGRISPDFALTLSATGVTPDMLGPFVTPHTLDGIFSFAASMTGAARNPAGSFTLSGTGLRLHGLSARAFPPSILEAHGTLRDSTVTLDAKLSGSTAMRLALKGDVSLEANGPIRLQADGTADLAIAGAFLAASGQSLSGMLSVDGQITGTFSAPRVNGNITLAGGEFRDYTRGIRLRAVDAAAEAQGDVIRIVKLNARAGQGTVSGAGTIGFPTSGMPVDVRFTAKNARPLVSDRLTAAMDADVKLTGHFGGDLALAGSIRVLHGEINVPDKYPPGVAVLDVRRKGQAAPARVESENAIALDLSVATPGHVFVRGRGLDAELAGDLAVKGTTQAPLVLGALDMRRGTLSLAGQTLVFRSGTLSFDGSSLKTSLDPTLDFTVETDSGGITATLNVSGYASAPQIKLSSTLPLPQDEVIAQILFQQSIKQLSALQLAQIAEALASLSGVGTGFNPVGMIRKKLRLDRLSVGSTSTGNAETSTTTIEAGKYVTHDVYVGAKQDLSGGTRAVVEIDITKNLKAQAAVNTGATAVTTAPGATPADTGDSVGLSYQFEY
ncbi:MAG TPA: translocation/assembly module TamB domain-containing protein, partial [Rhizomicrobium sp.]